MSPHHSIFHHVIFLTLCLATPCRYTNCRHCFSTAKPRFRGMPVISLSHADRCRQAALCFRSGGTTTAADAGSFSAPLIALRVDVLAAVLALVLPHRTGATLPWYSRHESLHSLSSVSTIFSSLDSLDHVFFFCRASHPAGALSTSRSFLFCQCK